MALHKRLNLVMRTRRYFIQKMHELLFANAGLSCALNCYDSTQNQETPVGSEDVPSAYLIGRLRQGAETRKPVYSFEISPPKTEEKFQELMKSTAGVMSSGLTLFSSVTWHLPSPRRQLPSTDWSTVPPVRTACHMARLLQPSGGVPGVVLNVSGVGLKEYDMASILEAVRKKGDIHTLFLVRGDAQDSGSDFVHGADLVKFVRRHPLGSGLTIGVAGYPLGHPECSSYEEDLLHLKRKVEAGAEFIISQIVFDAETFLQFWSDCRRLGIKVPVMAGVPIVTSAVQLRNLCSRCRVPVPETLLLRLKQGGAERGLCWCVSLTQQLVAAGAVAVHFFTLNSIDNLKEVLRRLRNEASCRRDAESDEHPPTATKSKESLSD